MLSFRTVLPQYQLSPPKVQTLCNVLDIPVAVWNTYSATQQLSNSATQQLSNSATQHSGRKNCLRPDKRAGFSFRQRHHYFFSSIFADGKRCRLSSVQCLSRCLRHLFCKKLCIYRPIFRYWLGSALLFAAAQLLLQQLPLSRQAMKK